MRCSDCENEAVSNQIQLCGDCMGKAIKDPVDFKKWNCKLCGVRYWSVEESKEPCSICSSKSQEESK